MIPGLATHLWQSTLFAGAAWLVTFGLRKNPAEVRYRIWFIASVKFLVPFSLLVGLGTLVPRHGATPSQTVWMTEAEQIVQPITTLPAIAARVAVTAGGANRNYFAAAAVVLWVCGFAAIAICWLLRWKRIHGSLKSAVPARILSAAKSGVPAMSVPDLVEPGIFGIFRPVLLVPQGIGEQLEPAQLEAILAHELCHVRRRDNLTAAIHMAVQAIFWFHPLVWWLGARLVGERERACDEEVLGLGSKPQVYASGILRVCKLYTESPLACVPGVTGADLKKRIETIMKNRNVLRLNLVKKTALVIAGVAAVTAPVVVGVVNPSSIRAQTTSSLQPGPVALPKFEVASVKVFRDDGGSRNAAAYGPQGVNFGGVTLAFIIGEAYQFPVGRIQGTGSLTKEELWAPLRQGYDIAAKADHPVPKDQLRLMLQSLLAERFKLVLHREAQTGLLYKLVIARNGPKLDPAQAAEPFAFSNEPSGYSFRSTDMVRLSAFLSGNVDRPVVDQTGLNELYNFILKRPDDLTQDPSRMKTEGGISPDSPSAATFGAALKQLGLQLNADRGPVDYLVIDSVEKPSEN